MPENAHITKNLQIPRFEALITIVTATRPIGQDQPRKAGTTPRLSLGSTERLAIQAITQVRGRRQATDRKIGMTIQSRRPTAQARRRTPEAEAQSRNITRATTSDRMNRLGTATWRPCCLGLTPPG